MTSFLVSPVLGRNLIQINQYTSRKGQSLTPIFVSTRDRIQRVSNTEPYCFNIWNLLGMLNTSEILIPIRFWRRQVDTSDLLQNMTKTKIYFWMSETWCVVVIQIQAENTLTPRRDNVLLVRYFYHLVIIRNSNEHLTGPEVQVKHILLAHTFIFMSKTLHLYFFPKGNVLMMLE